MSDIDRRMLLAGAVSGLAMAFQKPSQAARSSERTVIRALAFDAFAILDPRPISVLCERLYPQRGAELAKSWRVRQFEYQWQRALSGHYADFEKTSEDALVFATRSMTLSMTPEDRQQLLGTYFELKAWPDVAGALLVLRQRGVRLGFLSNATPRILAAGIKNSKLDDIFEHVLSTDSIKTYKPDRRAYQLAIDAFRLPKEQIGFVAFAGWDAAGAKTFGYPTYWINRTGAIPEELDVQPDAVLSRFTGLSAVVAK